ncbi:GmrSD restriction endonuclease domain-containing protein [Paracoccus seriniphilus]|uniref:GmrSD restriction endonucleases N-terminal domain-containing protein n=1 Tax=Paracoccus seriniphilus TaxID=184748 RepID=A0A239Q311_9RHOB|nr:DUF262 domain-containing protein [Paracoccus seriniphilus]WCR14014.1 DUF262 domain-containing protein [Paracoccus seriniphilus]SNT76840.1 hypothetical protein SAMN05444959_1318 [Paracoccus seriniphilus]
MSTFDSTKLPLPQVLSDVTSGVIQLPDFQRGWVWDDEHVKSLLVSIARSFPVGAVMMLDTGGDVRFQVRPVENVDFNGPVPEPEKLILDGQQRLTSLTQVLALDKPVKTFNEKGKAISRHYYIDIDIALEDDRLEEAFISVPDDRKIKTNFDRDVVLDLSTRELEIKNFFFPCSQILSSDAWEEDLHEYAPEKFGKFMAFRKNVLTAFRSYQLPAITLGKATSKEAVCLVFEKVNTGGVPLSVFELMTATFAADGFNLRDDWYGSTLRSVEGRYHRLSQEPILRGTEPADFLQAISILQSWEKRQADIQADKKGKMISAVSAKRATVLSLTLQDYEKWAPLVEEGFMLAAKFMRKECFFDGRELPYRTQLVPLAAVLSQIKERWLEPKVHDRLSRWFWCGVLGELYGGAVETRIANDFEDLMPWLLSDPDNESNERNGSLPRTISEAAFQESRLDTLRSRNSAAYKGLNILVLREGARDFFWKATIKELADEDTALDIHHIFPRAWCEDNGIKANIYNAIVNKTPISYKANRMIGRKAPSEYLAALQKHTQVALDDEAMNDILTTHRIPADLLRANDFHAFYAHRKAELLRLVESAMGKSAQLDQTGVLANSGKEE